MFMIYMSLQPEGIEQEYSYSLLIDLSSSGISSYSFELISHVLISPYSNDHVFCLHILYSKFQQRVGTRPAIGRGRRLAERNDICYWLVLMVKLRRFRKTTCAFVK